LQQSVIWDFDSLLTPQPHYSYYAPTITFHIESYIGPYIGEPIGIQVREMSQE